MENAAPSSTSKTVIAAVGAGVGVFFLYKIIKLWVDNKSTFSANKILADSINSIDSNKLTISQAQANSIAQEVYYAMKDMGSDEDKIEDLLIGRALTNEDIKLIVQAFGTKKYNNFGSPMFDWMGGDDMNLMQWLDLETSGRLHATLKTKFEQAGFIF